MNTYNRWHTILVTCFFLLCLAVIGTGSTAVAKTPTADVLSANQAQTQTYSGQLTNLDGTAVADGKYDINFSLYDAAENGNLLWTEQQTGVVVSAGKFSTILGSSTAFPTLSFDNTSTWLEVSVRGPGETQFTTLSPRMDFAHQSGINALTCPHNHYADSWSGDTSYDALFLENLYTTANSDALHAVSYNTDTNHGAIYARNWATTGAGDAINTHSDRGVGLRASSLLNDGIDATTSQAGKSAVYAHTTAGYGVYATSSATGSSYPNESRAIQGTGTGTYTLGGWLLSTQNAGAIIQTNVPASYVGLLVDGGMNIINGVCGGCAIVYKGMNTSAEDIRKGDLVALIGVEVDASTQQPIFQVKRASSEADVIIGVSIGPAADPSDPTRSGPETPGKSGSGVTATAEYVNIVVSGLAQVRADSANISLGSRLTAGSNGAIVTAEASSSIARVMSEVDANGFVWALINGR